MDKCRKQMQLAGYLVDTVEKTGRFHKQKDLFGLFDIFCIRKGVAVLIQVTSNKPHKHNDYQEFSKKYHNNGIEFWQWAWIDNKGWKRWQYQMGGKTLYDETKK